MTSKSERSPAQHKDFAPCVLNIDVHKQRAKSGHTKKKKKKIRGLASWNQFASAVVKTRPTALRSTYRTFSLRLSVTFFFLKTTRKKSKKKIIFFYKYPRSIFICTERNEMRPLDGRQSDESGTNRVTRITPQFLLVSK